MVACRNGRCFTFFAFIVYLFCLHRYSHSSTTTKVKCISQSTAVVYKAVLTCCPRNAECLLYYTVYSEFGTVPALLAVAYTCGRGSTWVNPVSRPSHDVCRDGRENYYLRQKEIPRVPSKKNLSSCFPPTGIYTSMLQVVLIVGIQVIARNRRWESASPDPRVPGWCGVERGGKNVRPIILFRYTAAQKDLILPRDAPRRWGWLVVYALGVGSGSDDEWGVNPNTFQW